VSFKECSYSLEETDSRFGRGEELLLNLRRPLFCPSITAGVQSSSDESASLIWLASGALFTLIVRPAKFTFGFARFSVVLVDGAELSPLTLETLLFGAAILKD
jgi:hypothetical protein